MAQQSIADGLPSTRSFHEVDICLASEMHQEAVILIPAVERKQFNATKTKQDNIHASKEGHKSL